MLDLVARVVMLSGASRGTGQAVVERLVAAGQVSAGVRDARGLAGTDRLLPCRTRCDDPMQRGGSAAAGWGACAWDRVWLGQSVSAWS